jgi:DNA invertase Pin-like site-specific DNA recombinase
MSPESQAALDFKMQKETLSAQDEANRKVFGYARVSTPDQNLNAQILALEAAGCDRIFSEKISAAAGRRRQLELLLKVLRRGDTLIVQRLDRLGRDVLGLGKMVRKFERDGIEFKSLSDSIDTSTPMGKAFFYMAAVMAELERNLAAERTRIGMQAAKERGVTFGRAPKINATNRDAVLADIRDTSMKMTDVAKKHGLSATTLNAHFPGERQKAIAEAMGR